MNVEELRFLVTFKKVWRHQRAETIVTYGSLKLRYTGHNRLALLIILSMNTLCRLYCILTTAHRTGCSSALCNNNATNQLIFILHPHFHKTLLAHNFILKHLNEFDHLIEWQTRNIEIVKGISRLCCKRRSSPWHHFLDKNLNKARYTQYFSITTMIGKMMSTSKQLPKRLHLW